MPIKFSVKIPLLCFGVKYLDFLLEIYSTTSATSSYEAHGYTA